MKIPSSTYRIQLHKDFTFRDLEGIIDYLYALGISTIYAAPIVQATPGSMHGYDVIDPHSINREIGTLSDLQSLARKLKSRNMTWIQDIVPNHMAFNTLNFRLMDVLERGEFSPYYRYFDIDWEHPSAHLNSKLQVPFLGDHRECCMERKEIKLSFSGNGFTVDYFTTSYPLSLSAFEFLFSGTSVFAWEKFVRMGQSAQDYNDWKDDKEFYLSSLVNDESQHLAILEFLEMINDDRDKLLKLLDHQFYFLTYWKDTEREINYRRFFTVNELICLRMEEAFVFDEYHAFLHSLYRDNLIQGLRIDHIDGLKEPLQYISRLRKLFGEECYIIAEKILESKEDIPEHWPLQGTSGYEFLAYANQLMTSRKGAKEILSFYRELVPQLPPYKELVRINKQLILERYMAGEWENLNRFFIQSGLNNPSEPGRIKKALGVFMIALPVYRIYPDKLPLRGHDVSILNQAFERARAQEPGLKPEFDQLQSLFTCKSVSGSQHPVRLSFLQRLMQFTGPLTAKGVEDTTFYVYNALVSHDEVGDSPYTLGMSISAFHQTMTGRQQNTPLSLNATSTHDTKRGEDARLRLNALCEFAGQWKKFVGQWTTMNRKFHSRMPSGSMAPEINDEYYIYQAIAGGFPEEGNVTEEWVERLVAYYTKVLREAKVNSDWADPNKAYEEACHAFIRAIVWPGSEFMESFEPFITKVIARANLYALAQVLIKVTAPGIPDIYQGCELWDLSFVDPDNRRPVDYKKRIDLLSTLGQKEEQGQAILFSFLEDQRKAGIEKLFVTQKSLQFRKKNLRLFADGSYIPLQTTGKETIAIAFARKLDDQWALVVVPLGVRSNSEKNPSDVLDTEEIVLPEGAPQIWQDVFTGEEIRTDGRITLSEILSRFPVALLRNC
jgi:(1->4)-alpha-D-glucan 1-alpha-D-glucosylmutase